MIPNFTDYDSEISLARSQRTESISEGANWKMGNHLYEIFKEIGGGCNLTWLLDP